MLSASIHCNQCESVSSVVRGGEDSRRIVITVTNISNYLCEDDFFSSIVGNISYYFSRESDIYGKKTCVKYLFCLGLFFNFFVVSLVSLFASLSTL